MYNIAVTSFQLKLIAIVTMAIDHIGIFFFSNEIILRIFGRVSFPIFAWLLANGARHTRNIHAYLLRLFIFACISQPFYYLAYSNIDKSFNQLNVLFTLFIGLGTIFFIKRTKNIIFKLLIIIVTSIIASLLRTDYGALGVLSIVFFYIFFYKKALMIASQIVIYVFMFWLWLPFVPSNQISGMLTQYLMETAALFSLYFIVTYNGQQGRKLKYLFYVIYPAQFVVFYILQMFLFG